jgi:hypothetical protein
MGSKTTQLRFTTAHYKFDLTITERNDKFHTFTFLVGDKNKPCLEGNIILKNNTGNDRYDSVVNTATLIKIDALQECSLDEITNEYMEAHSFGKEMLDSIVFFINSQFPTVETVKLDDASYIPCIRDSANTLDLLIYYIALYGKTWYEDKVDAYIKPKAKYDEYRKQVDNYMSKETKNKTDFSDIYKLIIRGSDFTKNIVDSKYKDIESDFNTSKTLPDFFIKLNKRINRKDKCRFFKNWLEDLIHSYITITRTWYFDLFPKIEPIRSNQMRQTRKRKNLII